MIICTKNKVAIFLSPKTGTFSLFRGFKEHNLYRCEHAHSNYTSFQRMAETDENIGDPSQYRLFCFYRDPMDRALSMLRHIKRRKCHEMFHSIYGNQVKISALGNNTYFGLSPELRKLNDDTRMIDVFRKMKYHRDITYKKQVHWLDHPANIEYLNFKNFNEEFLMLANLLGIEHVRAPVTNVSIKVEPYIDYLSPEEEQEIRDYYKEDYDFMREKGLL